MRSELGGGPCGEWSNGERHQSAPSAVALTEEALTVPDENSMPALTHLQGGWVAPMPPRRLFVVAARTGASEEKDCGAAPANMTRPPWSHSISQSALTVTSATTNGWRSEVKTIGAVDVSPFGGLRHRSVFGPAAKVKYSMHWGRENVDGRLRAVNEVPSGGISAYSPLVVLYQACSRLGRSWSFSLSFCGG